MWPNLQKKYFSAVLDYESPLNYFVFHLQKVKDRNAVIIQFDSGLYFPAVDFVHAQMLNEGLNGQY